MEKETKKSTKSKTVFETLYEINVNDRTEKKNGLTYLSWAYAWAEVKKVYPEAKYTVYESESGCIYHTDGKTCWVKTGAEINGLEYIEYLPVMDYRNKSIPVANITSVDVNKAIQRSLTKVLARHGLGLYIYAGEDLPESEANTEQGNAIQEQDNTPWQTGKLRDTVAYEVDETNKDARKLIIKIGQKYPDKSEKLISNICEKYGVKTIFELTDEQMKEVKEKL